MKRFSIILIGIVLFAVVALVVRSHLLRRSQSPHGLVDDQDECMQEMSDESLLAEVEREHRAREATAQSIGDDVAWEDIEPVLRSRITLSHIRLREDLGADPNGNFSDPVLRQRYRREVQRMEHDVYRKNYHRLLRHYDLDGSGIIDGAGLHKLVEDARLALEVGMQSRQGYEAMLRLGDHDDDGEISYIERLNITKTAGTALLAKPNIGRYPVLSDTKELDRPQARAAACVDMTYDGQVDEETANRLALLNSVRSRRGSVLLALGALAEIVHHDIHVSLYILPDGPPTMESQVAAWDFYHTYVIPRPVPYPDLRVALEVYFDYGVSSLGRESKYATKMFYDLDRGPVVLRTPRHIVNNPAPATTSRHVDVRIVSGNTYDYFVGGVMTLAITVPHGTDNADVRHRDPFAGVAQQRQMLYLNRGKSADSGVRIQQYRNSFLYHLQSHYRRPENVGGRVVETTHMHRSMRNLIERRMARAMEEPLDLLWRRAVSEDVLPYDEEMEILSVTEILWNEVRSLKEALRQRDDNRIATLSGLNLTSPMISQARDVLLLHYHDDDKKFFRGVLSFAVDGEHVPEDAFKSVWESIEAD